MAGALMEFLTPEFPPVGEIFVTVRRGSRWGRWGSVALGDLVYLADNARPADIHGVAELLARTEGGPVSSIPPSWLAREHLPSCRTLEGLLSELKRCYSDFEDDHDVVALLMLRVK